MKINSNTPNIQPRKRWSRGRKAVAAVVGMSLAGGAAFAAFTLTTSSFDGQQSRVAAEISQDPAPTCDDDPTSSIGFDPTVDGAAPFDIGACRITGSSNDWGINLEDTYAGYQPTVDFRMAKVSGPDMQVTDVQLVPLSGTWAGGEPPLALELADGSSGVCSTPLNSSTSKSYKVRITDTGLGTPEPFLVSFNYGPLPQSNTPADTCLALDTFTAP